MPLTIYPATEFTEVMLSDGDEWIVEGLLPVKGHTQIYGQEGHGKSWGGLELAVCIATGQDWFTLKTVRTTKVLYVATERARTTAKRLVEGYDYGAPIPNLMFTEEEFHLDQPQTITGMPEAFAEQGIEVVIFDTLARNHGATPWKGGEVLESITKFQRHCAVVVINHTMKGSTDSYGGGHMLNSQDARVRFVKLDDNLYDVSVTKLSGAESWEPFQFHITDNRPKLVTAKLEVATPNNNSGGRTHPDIKVVHGGKRA
jgi:AAA domain